MFSFYSCWNISWHTDSGASFQLFLGGPNLFNFSMQPDYWKIGKNSTLAICSNLTLFNSILFSFFFLFSSFFFFFFFLFPWGGGATAPSPLKWRPCTNSLYSSVLSSPPQLGGEMNMEGGQIEGGSRIFFEGEPSFALESWGPVRLRAKPRIEGAKRPWIECEAQVVGAMRSRIEGEARVEGAKRQRIEDEARTNTGRGLGGSVSPSPEKNQTWNHSFWCIYAPNIWN